jgi:nicotinate-nucleotide pyrophosphorylase (carboxylating)
MDFISHLDLSDLLRRAVAEDVGQGDITTAATVAPGRQGIAKIRVKEPSMILAGGFLIAQVFDLCGAKAAMTRLAPESSHLHAGDTLAEIRGDLAGLLIGERTALNFVQLLSGIATATRAYVDAIAGTRARIVDTRKTHPGLRALEKYAVRAGGGHNHRLALDSGVLIKENHVAAAGGIVPAIENARALAPHTVKIEVECEAIAQVEQAIAAHADIILLDNMALADIRRARALVPAGILLEVSGGVTLDTVRAIAETGVDIISCGALTHSPKAVDISMRIERI